MFSAWIYDSFLKHLIGMDATTASNTTLNEKYNILVDQQVPEGIMPKLKYFGIGVGGVGTEHKTGLHRYVDGDLYNPIPFIARTVDNDLSSAEASKYRMRVVTTINGTPYVLYYLKTIEQTSEAVSLKTITKNSVDSTYGSVDQYDTNNPLVLNPSPNNIVDTQELTKTTYLITECRVPIDITLDEVEEIINAYKILTGLDTIPNISEMCLYTGLDTTTEGRLEAYAVRSGVFYPVPHDLQAMLDTETPIQRYIDIGGGRMM